MLDMGTSAMGGTVEPWGLVDDRESIETIHQALDRGINLIDTAPIYGFGHGEEIVGKALLGRRHQAVIATKCGLLFPSSKEEPPVRCLSKASILRECESSLRRLRTDAIDLYQCHWPDPQTPVAESMEALTSLLRNGKIRAIGVSNFSCDQIGSLLACGPVHSAQISFSMLNRRASEDMFPFCEKYGIAVLPYSPLAKGLLTGKFHHNSRFTGIRARDPDFLGDRFRTNLQVVASLGEIAATYGKTIAQLALCWTIHHPQVTAPIFGAKKASQVLENVDATGWTIADADLARIDAVLAEGTSGS